MARQSTTVEVNTFVGGLFTDASPLTFPPNASLDEDNMVLNPNGLRQRRLGMDYEANFSEITTGITYVAENTYGHTSFRWDNAGSDASESLLVVQFGNEVKFFNLNNEIISSEVILTHTFSEASTENIFGFAVADGVLTVVTGEKLITTFVYNIDANSISVSTDFLKIRDLFGIAVTIGGEDLTDGNNVTIRPSTTSDEHKYNLRNQSWAEPRLDGNKETLRDTIRSFFFGSSDTPDKRVYPSNSDSVIKALYPDATDTDNRTVERFFAKDLFNNKFGTTQAAKGHYIIDAMDRGLSRKEAYDQTVDNSPISLDTVSSLPTDRTAGGPSVVTEYSGRKFYAGFNGALIAGDSKSPRMSSFVLFSKKIEDVGDVVRCYQDGDPTSLDETDLIATDGGFIRLDGAYGIRGSVVLGDSLFVLAANGVWRIFGSDAGGFSATAFGTFKLTENGVVSATTLVVVNNSLFYWSDDGIYAITQNQVGDWVANNISVNKINTLYETIDSAGRRAASGQFDGFDNKVRWIYDNELADSADVKELIFDIQLGAWYTNTLITEAAGSLPKAVGMFSSNPFTVALNDFDVVVGADVVEASAVGVVISGDLKTSNLREVQYVTVTDLATVIKYTFSKYRDTDFLDYKSFPASAGQDAAGFMVTGYISGGDFQRAKQAPFITTHMQKTETGYIEVGDDFVAVGVSSVMIQTQWSWSDHANSNLWGTAFECYRHNRLYIPESVGDPFEDGHSVVSTRHRLRGQGPVLSLKFSTSAGKDFRLYGWSFVLAVETEV